MKLFAHSQLPVNPTPYMHLGYVSAAPMNATLFGLMGLAIAWFIGHHFLTKLPKTIPMRITGVSFYVIGLCALVLGFHNAGIASKEVKTRYTIMLNLLSYKISPSTGKGHGIAAKDIHELQQELGLKDEEIRDAWSRELHFSQATRKGKLEYQLRSAGHDGRFDTDDDLVQKRSFPVEPGPSEDGAPATEARNPGML